MKNIYIILIIGMGIFASINAFAQPELNATMINPVVGESFEYNTFDASSVDQGGTGANVTWDFSSLTSNGTGTLDYISPSGTSYASSFPQANIAFTQSSATLFYSATSSGLTSYGYVASILTIPYTDPEELIHYPFTFNSSFSDTYTGEYTNIVTYTRNGTINVLADSYGTLILPNGTVTDVLRLSVIEDYSDKVSGITVTTGVTHSYYWYKPGIHMAVFGMTSVDLNGTIISNSGTYLQNLVGIADPTANQPAKVTPNPCRGSFKVSTKDVSEITLTDLSGKTIRFTRTEKGTDQINFNLDGISGGLYFVKIRSNHGVSVQKLLVE